MASLPAGPPPNPQPGRLFRRAERRSLWAFGALAAGYWLAREAHIVASGPFLLACGLFALAAMFCRPRALIAPILVCSVLCFGLGWYALRIHEPPRHAFQPGPITAANPGIFAAEPVPVRVRGVIVEPPEVDPPPNAVLAEFFRTEPSVSFVVALQSADVTESGPAPDSALSLLTPLTSELPARGKLRVRVPLLRAGVDVRERHPTEPLLFDVHLAPLRAGDPVMIEGLFRPLRPPMNPGERDRRAWAAQQGEVGHLFAPSTDLITRLNTDQAGPFARIIAIVRRNVAALRAHARVSLASALNDSGDAPYNWERSIAPSLDDNRNSSDGDNRTSRRGTQSDQLREQGRALLAAMLLGAREEHLPQITDAFTRLGLTHLVAISGFNMVVLSGLVVLLVRLTGDRGGLEPLIACLVITLYLIVLPLEAPSLRGGLMVMCFIAAENAGRRYDRLTILGWLALVIAIVHPLDAFTPGFQLTFCIVGALVWVAPGACERLFGPDLRGVQRPALPVGTTAEARAERAGMRARRALGSFWRGCKLAMTSALTAWAVATPIVVYHTGLVSMLAPFTTLIVGPLCSLFIAFGYVALLVGALWPEAASWLSPLLDTMGLGLVRLVYLLDAVPAGTLRLPPISAGLAVAGSALAVWWLKRGRVKDRTTLLLTAGYALWFALAIHSAGRLPSRTLLRIDSIAVGDGTCLLLRSDDRTALWDCGSLNPFLGARALPDALRALGIARIDTAFITHANIDHFAALADVARVIPIDRIVTTEPFMDAAQRGQTANAPGWQRSVAEFHAHMTAPGLSVPFEAVSASQQLQFGHARVHILWPDSKALANLDPAPRRIDPNDLSMVARFDVPVAVQTSSNEQVRSILLTGDASRLALPLLLETHASDSNNSASAQAQRHALRAEILEIPHHGSFNEPAAELLRRVNPSVVLQSTGPRRASDTRWANAMPEFFLPPRPDRPALRTWLTTARHGWSAVVVDRDGSISKVSTR